MRIACIFGILVIMGVSGCDQRSGNPASEADAAAARQKWANGGIPPTAPVVVPQPAQEVRRFKIVVELEVDSAFTPEVKQTGEWTISIGAANGKGHIVKMTIDQQAIPQPTAEAPLPK